MYRTSWGRIQLAVNSFYDMTDRLTFDHVKSLMLSVDADVDDFQSEAVSRRVALISPTLYLTLNYINNQARSDISLFRRLHHILVKYKKY